MVVFRIEPGVIGLNIHNLQFFLVEFMPYYLDIG